jgi:hypothetical protein
MAPAVIDAANAGLAEFCHFFEQSARDLRRGIVGIDQHGEAGQALLFGFHRGTSMTFVMHHIGAILPGGDSAPAVILTEIRLLHPLGTSNDS